MNPLVQLIHCGQSYWMDNLSRRMLVDGALSKRLKEQGLRGITSNPAIFHKAITGSSDYDAQIKALAPNNYDVATLYEHLAVKDVQDACDIMRPVFDESDGVDGYVSLEVSPYLAHDTAGTMQEARRLWSAVSRPNVLIKIPGLPAGVPAIEQMLYEGINVNVTLLFGVTDYEAVAQAYIKALQRRVAENKPVRAIASVASFFLSRIDVLVDQLLQHRVLPSAAGSGKQLAETLYGKIGVANAKLAYQSFLRLFQGPTWDALAAQGARVQRPLWASTSTKNPHYSDVMYVNPLIGKHTVTTLPDETITAFADHGTVVADTVEADIAEARRLMHEALPQVGIDFDNVVWQLQNEGVQKFIEPFDNLLGALQKKK